ncbi:hypothetical protein [Streptomyces sp. V1I6]|uniref:hypothetical protein n=1 Tax=Streptomyces sp. V1I6 TaxID=3042273 RepID=UPI002787CB25|nr:hypothetical protein [Streptomyces sp. V1I6]MDQ0842427.1 hypothetical protein [Streptomyces sp. V1I6]
MASTDRSRTQRSVEHQSLDAFDSALRQFLAAPSHAHRFLAGVADVLKGDPFLTMTQDLLDEALNLSTQYILGNLDSKIVEETTRIATAELPLFAPGETTGLYAARIRASAEDLR